MQVAVAHMTVRIDDVAHAYVPLHYRYNVIHCLVSYAVANADLRLATVHAKHPAHRNVVA